MRALHRLIGRVCAGKLAEVNGAAAVAAAQAGAAERLVAMLRQRAPDQPVHSLLPRTANPEAHRAGVMQVFIVGAICMQQRSVIRHCCVGRALCMLGIRVRRVACRRSGSAC